MAKLALLLDLGSQSADVLSHKVLDISSHILGGGPCGGNFPALAIGLHAGNACTPGQCAPALVTGQWSLYRKFSCTCIRQQSM